MPELAVVLLLIFGTHVVGALATYGSTLLAVPLLEWATGDLRGTVFVLVLLGAVQSYHILWYTWRDIHWGELGKLTLWVGATMPIGMIAARFLPRTPLMVGLGLALLVGGILALGQRHHEGPPPPRLGWPARLLLLAGGVIHGAFGTGGATVVVVAHQRLHRKETFRATLCAFWAILNTVLVAVLALGELPEARAWGWLLWGLPVLFAANWLGQYLATILPTAPFRRLVAVLLVLAAVTTLARALQ